MSAIHQRGHSFICHSARFSWQPVGALRSNFLSDIETGRRRPLEDARLSCRRRAARPSRARPADKLLPGRCEICGLASSRTPASGFHIGPATADARWTNRLQSFDLQINRRSLAAALLEFEFQVLTFIESAEARPLDRGDVNEDVLAAAVGLDKTETLLRVNLLCRFTRAREAPTAPQLLPAASAVADSFLANSGSRRTLEPAPVELSYGASPTRWPQPQHGKGALELGLCLAAALNAAALKDRRQGAALTCFVALRVRARRRPSRCCGVERSRRFLLANSGSRRTLDPALVELSYGASPTRWPQPQHGKGGRASSVCASLRL